MRVLRLGSSIDSEGETAPEERAAAIAAALLEAACGEPVETILRVPWPGPAMAETVERWVEEFRPDFVCFNVSSHWCESEVLALRLREFGPIGRWVAGILDRNTKNYAFNANPLVRLGRKLAAFTIGGRPPSRRPRRPPPSRRRYAGSSVMSTLPSSSPAARIPPPSMAEAPPGAALKTAGPGSFPCLARPANRSTFLSNSPPTMPTPSARLSGPVTGYTSAPKCTGAAEKSRAVCSSPRGRRRPFPGPRAASRAYFFSNLLSRSKMP